MSEITVFYYLPRNKFTVQARISRSGTRICDKSTKIKLGPGQDFKTDFDVKTKRFVNNREANKALNLFEADVEAKARELSYLYRGQVPDQALADAILGRAVAVGERATLSGIVAAHESLLMRGMVTNAKTGKMLAPDTVHSYVGALAAAKRYLKSNPDFDFSKYNVATIPVLGPEVQTRYKEFITGLKKFLTSEGNEDSTVSSYLARLKHVITYHLKPKSIVPMLEEMKYQAPEKDVVVLEPDQVDFVLTNYDRIHSECQTRDEMDALQYWYTALILNPRKSDMNAWDKNNIVTRGEQVWIKYMPRKTRNSSGLVVEDMVPERLLQIFRDNLEKHGKLLPPAKTHIVRTLRKIAARYKIFHNEVQVLRRGEFVTKRLCDVMHVHMMRGSGITRKLMSGMADAFVKDSSGHMLDSKAFRRYAKVVEKSKAEVTQDYYKKLKLL